MFNTFAFPGCFNTFICWLIYSGISDEIALYSIFSMSLACP